MRWDASRQLHSLSSSPLSVPFHPPYPPTAPPTVTLSTALLSVLKPERTSHVFALFSLLGFHQRGPLGGFTLCLTPSKQPPGMRAHTPAPPLIPSPQYFTCRWRARRAASHSASTRRPPLKTSPTARVAHAAPSSACALRPPAARAERRAGIRAPEGRLCCPTRPS